MDPTPEQQPQAPIREVKIGEWFRPFENYDQIPYFINYPTQRGKSLRFKTEKTKWGITLYNYEDEFADKDFGLEGAIAIIASNADEKISSYQDIIDYQNRMETKLMLFASGLAIESEAALQTHRLEIRLPSGTILTAELNEDYTFQPWKGNKGEYDDLFIPDIANMMERVELKIDKI